MRRFSTPELASKPLISPVTRSMARLHGDLLGMARSRSRASLIPRWHKRVGTERARDDPAGSGYCEAWTLGGRIRPQIFACVEVLSK